MKKCFYLFIILMFPSIQAAFSQVAITGSIEYGRIFDLTYDANVPNKVYAVTLGNHIVVSLDNGVTWDILYTFPAGNGTTIKDLKLTPDGTGLTFASNLQNSTSSSLMVYDIATAEIIKTFPLPNQYDLAFLSSYDFYDGNMDVLVIDTEFPEGSFGTETKVFYTDDGGITWDMVYYSTDNNKISVGNVAISPNDPQKIFITRGGGKLGINGGLLISGDAGQTFVEKLPGIILAPITFDPSDNQTLFVGTGISFGLHAEHLYKSLNGGLSFSIVPISWTDDILDNINVIKFNPNNPSQVIVLEDNEIVISEDGGDTFQNYVYPSDDTTGYNYGLNASYNPQNSQQLFISGNYVPLFSTDGGETVTWTKSRYFTSTGTIDLFKNDTATNLYYGVQFGYVHRNLNTGIDTPYDILPLNTVSNSIGQTHYADKITPNRVYTFTTSFSGASLMVSDNNGVTDTLLTSLFTTGLAAVGTFPSNPQTILAAFRGAESYQSQLKHIDFSDTASIVETDIVLPNIDFINAIVIDTTGKIIIPIGAQVYFSTDNGTTWTNSSDGLESMTSSDLIFDLKQDPLNANRMALASNQGIFISEDGGATWSQKSTTLVHNVAFSTETVGAILASTYSTEVSEFALHYSTNNGETWNTLFNEQLLSIISNASTYLFADDSVKVYISTIDIGLMEYTIDLTVLNTPDFELDDNDLTIYPNPAKEVINIDLKGATINSVTVYSITGAKVMETDNASSLDISALHAGVYIVRVQNDEKGVFFKRIIKQ